MSSIQPVKKGPEGSAAEEASESAATERLESLKARYRTKKPDVTSKGSPQHLNPKPKKNAANSTGN